MGLIIFGFILVIALFIFLGIDFHNEEWKFRPRQILAIFGFAVILFGMVARVEANTVGILYDPLKGGVQEQTLSEGIHFKSPLAKVYSIDTTQQELAFEPFSVQTEGSEFAMFQVEIKYRASRENAYEVFRNYRGLPSNSVIRTDVQDAVKNAAESYNIYDILGSSYGDVKADAYDNLVVKLESVGMDLISLNFVDIDAGADIEAKIVEKGLAKQQKAIEEELLAAAQVAQEKDTTLAETVRFVKEQEAMAVARERELAAEAALIEKQKEAEGIKAIADAKAHEILALGNADAEAYQMAIDAFGSVELYNEYILNMQWNGDVPTFVMGENGMMMPIFDATEIAE